MLPSSLIALLIVALDSHHVLALPTTSRPMIPLATPDTPKTANSPGKRHADFIEVRTRLKVDHSGAGGDPEGKYFHEATFNAHYDGRFADMVLPEDQRDHALISLVRTYLATMSELRAETWLMHGSLLGWWWNRKIMPWDSDIDVQMSLESMNYLAAYHNMTIHEFTIPSPASRARGSKDVLKIDASDSGVPRSYLLEVNPNYIDPRTDDELNHIDARWIDTETGLFIDITTLRPDTEAAAQGKLGKMMCKDGHRYLMQDIFPLRISDFEGVPAKIPYAYSELLEEEYGRASLTRTSFEGHLFDQKTETWIPLFRQDSPAHVAPAEPERRWVPPEIAARQAAEPESRWIPPEIAARQAVEASEAVVPDVEVV